MSTFKAEVVKVEVVPHPNADRLDLVKVKGWQCVSQKGLYKTGDLVVYLPVDSVLPEPLVKALEIEKNYHRKLRTIKLRGEISQGMVMPLPRDPSVNKDEGSDLTQFLGITKWEEAIPTNMAGVMLPNEPLFQKYTDIENFKNFPGVFCAGDNVVVLEKIHGTNGRAAKINGQLFVGSHRVNLQEDEKNLYWRAAKLLDCQAKLEEGEQVFFEVYGPGVQDLTYGKKEIDVAVFDFMRNQTYLSYGDFLIALGEKGWISKIIPEVFLGEYDPKTTPLLAEGKSLICPSQIREGVVIKPTFEKPWNPQLQGRTILKSISDAYLLRKEGTERH